jgi:CBS domain-containing protein
MTKDPVAVGPSETVPEVARILDSNEISGLPVVDGQHRVIGVVSKTHLLHRCLEGPLGSRPGSFFGMLAEGISGGTDMDPEELGIVEDFMEDPVTVPPDEPVASIARKLARQGSHRAIVVDEDQLLLGIISSLDLLRAFPGQ